MLTAAARTLAQAALSRMGASIPLDASPDLMSLRMSIPATSTVQRIFTLPAPVAIQSLRVESTDPEAFLTEIKVGQVSLFIAPRAEAQTVDVAPATVQQMDTSQTRSGLRRPWATPLTSTTVRLSATNLTDEPQRLDVQLECYSPPDLLDSLARLLTALES
jgi:hypothetical protein